MSGSQNSLQCPHCASAKSSPRKRLTSLGYKTFHCKACQHGFNERTGTPYNDLHFPTDIVFQVLLCAFAIN
jgi:putative transposase